MAKVQGLARLKRAFKALPPAVEKAAQGEVEKAGQNLVAGMKAAAPIDSGALRGSIRAEAGRLRVTVRAGGAATTKDVREGSGKPYDYSLGVEFGTQKAPARAFFFPTYRAQRKGIGRGIYKAVRRAAGRAWRGS